VSVRETRAGHVVEQHSPAFLVEGEDGNYRITFEGATETVIIHLTAEEALDLIEELDEPAGRFW
jgi:hypothetical protein